MRKRIPLLTIKLPKHTVSPLLNIKCIGCAKTVSPQLSKTGSVLSGIMFKTLSGVERIGSEMIETSKRVGFWKRERGHLCESCCADYRTLTQRKQIGDSDLYEETHHSLVKVDPHVSFYSDSSLLDRTRPKLKTLNTRYTQ